MLSIRNLRFTYPNGRTFGFPDLDLKSGEHLLVTGPSGVGKSTLMALVAGFLQAESGSIKVEGTELVGLKPRQLDAVRRKYMGIISQRPRAIQAIDLGSNLRLVCKLTGNDVSNKTVLSSLASVGIDGYVKSKPADLSVGEKQRLAIAMATIHNPSLLLADEPTSSLDDDNAQRVISLLKEQVSSSNGSLVVISHDRRLIDQFKNMVRL